MRNYFTSHRLFQIGAYLLVVFACVFAVHRAVEIGKDARAELRASAQEVVRIGCEADRSTALALRRALDGQIEFVRNNPEPPPPTVEQRVEAIRELKNSIQVPDCEARARVLSEK